MGISTCIITNLVDSHFYLDTHPEYSHVTIAAGFGGKGFEFCSAVGETLADFVIRGEMDNPIEPNRLTDRL